MNINNVDFKETVDSDGRVILYSDVDAYQEYEPLKDVQVAYENCPFITLPKDDVHNVLEWYDKTCCNPRDDGELNISYNNVYDRINGVIIPATIICE